MEDIVVDPPIIGIGASAGGVKALQAFLEHLPPETGAAYVVILHLDPEHRSELPAILRNRTDMQVIQVDKPTRLLADRVYVIPPNRRLSVLDHMISAVAFEEPRGQRAPIDSFFRDLAAQHTDSFAIVLTGAGADGALGVKAIKEAGGIILVQDPKEAEYASMPRSAIATETADFILPVTQMGRQLLQLLHTRDHIKPGVDEVREDQDEAIRRILSHVQVRTGHDFSHYRRATILRRIARRAQVSQKESLAEYYTYLRENAEEAMALFGDFLISVTTFFRDPKSFTSLAQHAIPQLFEGKSAQDPIRVWVPGCATGEETYTLGVLLLEEASRREVRPEIMVFGTDLDAGALAFAREGRYPAAIEADLSEDRLRRFFLKEGDHYRVRRELRDIVLFASHSLLRDPPFSRLDLISCRNLLIYLDRDLQPQVCNVFHYALNPGGFLFLGSSESLDHPNGLFRPVDRDARIYQAVASSRDRRPAMPILMNTDHLTEQGHAQPRHNRPPGSISDAALHRQMLERIAPPSMLVDDTHRAIHLSDNAGRYLQPSGGPITTDASELVRPELRFDLRSALHRAFERSEPTLTMPIPVQFDASLNRVYLHVKPVSQDGGTATYALVLFIEGSPVDHPSDIPELNDHGPGKERFQQLQEELQLAQSRLRGMREESEAGNEELQAANEELQSINEEYRSTSEELETSKEELQSMNEELQAVNKELKLKLESVSRAHSDLQNLMAATDVGTLFLDTSLRIKRFTPRLTELFNITANDEGRPITDFTHQLDYDSLADHARDLLKNLAPIEHEVKSRNDGWYLVRMRPYRTVDDKIDGVVATFVDITQRRRAEDALRQSEEQLRQGSRMVDLSRSPIFVWNFDNGIIQWNRGSEELYGYTRDEAIGQHKEVLLQTVVPNSSFEAVKEALLKDGNWSGELLHRTKDGRVLTVESRIEMVSIGGRKLVLESTTDITDRKRWMQRQQLLLHELSHRVKNTLSVVQAMARQTMRTSGSNDDFLKRFDGRLMALNQAHTLLMSSYWEGAELGAMARAQLKAYLGEPNRLSIDGEKVVLPSELATPFGLIFHELATNAAKYGAFSNKKGRVALHWHIEKRSDQRHLIVTWKEQDGPAVIQPDKEGFGTSLISKAVPGANVTIDYRPQGVVCKIELKLPESGPNSAEFEPLAPGR